MEGMVEENGTSGGAGGADPLAGTGAAGPAHVVAVTTMQAPAQVFVLISHCTSITFALHILQTNTITYLYNLAITNKSVLLTCILILLKVKLKWLFISRFNQWYKQTNNLSFRRLLTFNLCSYPKEMLYLSANQVRSSIPPKAPYKPYRWLESL